MTSRRMNAGRLRHRVTIKEKSVTRNSMNEEVVSWTIVGTYWASVEPVRGREFVEMRQAQAEISHRIRMRYRSGIDPTMRAYFGSREFEIVSVIHVEERGRETQLMCNERVSYV
jgi:SPP1 family predicted phage head-tail adaptor